MRFYTLSFIPESGIVPLQKGKKSVCIVIYIYIYIYLYLCIFMLPDAQGNK